jgi:hypothetical protein
MVFASSAFRSAAEIGSTLGGAASVWCVSQADGPQSRPLSSVHDAGMVPVKLGGVCGGDIVVAGVFQSADPSEHELSRRGTRDQRHKDDVRLVRTSLEWR